ncbi:unnamed protein product [Phaedon cochleariae]|uniref:Integrase core domain-containing protein n=1 Tax=Phaedon cochleariae TaxID=80249 RepID=A0A9N9SHU7_PHACE|nr:unnamed protein product [Phaedon cochleariae]
MKPRVYSICSRMEWENLACLTDCEEILELKIFLLAQYIIDRRGTNRSSYITGRSVHNQRIERLWSEVNRVVTKHFKELFIAMEDENILSELDEIDLFFLRYVFLPRIQNCLEQFVDQWNNHNLSTMRGYSPLQLWQLGMIDNGFDVDMNDDPQYDTNPMDYGVDINDPITGIITQNKISIPLPHPDVMVLEQELRRIVPNPLSEDGRYGINQYLSVQHFLRASLSVSGD